MGAVKGAVLSLLLDAYQRRDKVGLVTFRGTGAEVALPPTSSVEAAAARLTACRPAAGPRSRRAWPRRREVLRTERLRDPRRRALLVVVTDGRATSGSDADLARAAGAAMLAAAGIACVVVDCESARSCVLACPGGSRSARRALYSGWTSSPPAGLATPGPPADAREGRLMPQGTPGTSRTTA